MTFRQPWEVGQRDEFRARFGEDIDAYDRTRPVAPDVVFDDIVGLAELAEGSTVVEIGPGSGETTQRLAARGLPIVAVEVDARLAARAQRNLAGFTQVSAETAPFESWDPDDEQFAAVFTCNSFHWAVGSERLDPATRRPELVDDWADAIDAAQLFGPATVTRHPFDVTFSADDYVANL